MIYSILIFLFIIIFFDSRGCYRQNKDSFKEYFKIPILLGGFLSILIFNIFIFAEKGWEAVVAFVFIFFLPLYFIKRYKFIHSLQNKDSRFLLASDAFGVILAWFFVGVATSGLVTGFMKLFPQYESELGELVITAVISSLFLIVLIYRVTKRFSNKGFLYNVGLFKGENSWAKLIGLPVILGLVFAAISIFIVFNREVVPQTPLSEIIDSTQSSLVILAFLAVAILVAPLMEEIIFRGYLFHVLKELRGRKSAIFFISISFALLHVGQYWGDWLAIFMVALLGFVLTYLRSSTGSTITSTVMHYVYNGGITIIPVIIIFLSNPPFFKYQAQFPYLNAHEKEVLLKRSIERQPDLADAYNDLAWLYVEERKNLDKALELINVALSFEPELDIYIDTKAAVLEALGRFDEATELRSQLDLERQK